MALPLSKLTQADGDAAMSGQQVQSAAARLNFVSAARQKIKDAKKKYQLIDNFNHATAIGVEIADEARRWIENLDSAIRAEDPKAALARLEAEEKVADHAYGLLVAEVEKERAAAAVARREELLPAYRDQVRVIERALDSIGRANKRLHEMWSTEHTLPYAQFNPQRGYVDLLPCGARDWRESMRQRGLLDS
jgi:hypothetical protein